MNAEPKNEVLLSIVVIGRNEGQRLTNCLESLQEVREKYPGTELIYVDSSSTDDSIARASAYTAKILSLFPKKASAALARNTGWKAAQGEFILFLDGDTILHPGYVSNALPRFTDTSIAVICGHRREREPHDSIYNYVFDIDWIYPTGFVDFCGGDALIRRKVLEQVGGYDETLIAGEEPDMCCRMRAKGYKVLRLDVPMTGHDLRMGSFSQYWRRCFRTGYAYAEIVQRQSFKKGALWVREAIHNVLKVGILFVLLLGSLIVLPWSCWPLWGVIGLTVILILGSAWRARHKADSVFGCLLYGLHAHFQHIPMFAGQCAFWIDHWRGTPRQIIEYK